MNNVTLMGRLAKDPDVRYTGEQMCVARFTIAVDRPKKDDNTADFISCVAFGKLGELIEKYFTKGKPIGVIGHIQTGSYEKDGQKVYTTNVVIDRIEFVPTDRTEKTEDKDDVQAQFEELDDYIPF